MTDTDFWDKKRNTIRSSKGGAIIGEGRVFSHGYSILEELLGKASFFQVLILNITGRLPEEALAKWIEASFVCLSWPDARIWCNQIGSLGGTLRTTPVAAIAAGIMASDSLLYGPGTVLGASEFITKSLRMREQGITIDSIVHEYGRNASAKPVIPGYARPLTHGDERIPAMERITENLGFDIGKHLSLAYEIQAYLFEHYEESLNFSGYIMAFLSDQELSPKDIYRIYSLCVSSGIHACYAEAYDNPPESFLPLRCEDVEYKGKLHRPLPPKQENLLLDSSGHAP
jgi:hypothetical protein